MKIREALNLHLEDTQWPKTKITHDRTIVRAIVIDDKGNFYFVEVNRDDDFGKAKLIETAGGGVEAGESLTEALERELKEELGVEINLLAKIGTVIDYYHLIHRRNHNHYYLCQIKSRGTQALTQAEIEDFQLRSLCLSYQEALDTYLLRSCSPIGKLIANREVPVLMRAKELLEESHYQNASSN